MSPSLKFASARVRALALVAVDSGGGDAVFIQLFRQMVSAVLGAGKHQHLPPVVFADQVRQQFTLAFLVHKVHVLGHQFGRGIAAHHFHRRRIGEQLPGQFLDFIGEGGGKQPAPGGYRG